MRYPPHPTTPALGTVLVTGGAGFIGRSLAAAMAPAAQRWVAVDNLNPRTHGPEPQVRLPGGAHLVVADITRAQTWDELLSEWTPDLVIHLAAETDTGLSLEHATRFADVNVGGTAAMLDAFTRHETRPGHVLLASSRAVYGEGMWREVGTGRRFSPGQRSHQQLLARHWDFPGSEPLPAVAGDTMPHPTSIYGATKLAQESFLSSWSCARDVPLTVLRLQNVYGPGQSLLNPYTGLLPLLVQRAARGESLEVYEDGAMRRDFVHIDDVTSAFAAACARPPATSVLTLDIGCGVGAPILDVAETISATMGAGSPQVTGAFRDGDVRHTWCTTDAAEHELGWRPEIAWREGIAAYARWYLTDHEEDPA